MKKLLPAILIIGTSFACATKKNTKLLLRQWFPINAETDNSQLLEQDSYLNLLTFQNDSLSYRVLGSNFEQKFKYQRTDSLLLLTNDTIFISKLTEKELQLKYDSLITVTYIPFPEQNTQNQIEELETKLISGPWWHKVFEMEFLIEFRDIEDKSPFSPFRTMIQHSYTKDRFEDHQKVSWSLEHINKTNLLICRSEYNWIPHLVILINDFNDSTIIGSSYFGGVEHKIEFKKATVLSEEELAVLSNKLTMKTWQLKKYHLAVSDSEGFDKMDFFEPIDPRHALTKKDFDNKTISLKFDRSGNYHLLRKKDTVINGKWQFDKTGHLIELENGSVKQKRYQIPGGFISVISLESNRLVFCKEEELHEGNSEFTILNLIEEYH
ncbi:hypothetical protein QQ008_10950 [Fulvivirgaceae bacterium BMA10]|uniref:Lipoprotein n=1 Tax=Splendidivirga corallicola TaxID=3051826 RepID=A0ABT8KPD1_9BACT|nr:hypothetical protein [Fulvivirgaceae bacterium BMA10]